MLHGGGIGRRPGSKGVRGNTGSNPVRANVLDLGKLKGNKSRP